MTADLEALRDWLRERGVSHVAMESTGVFWKPVYAVLEGHVEIVVGNAQHIRNVPDRHQGCRVAVAAPRPDPGELRAAAGVPGTAAVPAGDGSGACAIG
jgi:hypothetical protein